MSEDLKLRQKLGSVFETLAFVHADTPIAEAVEAFGNVAVTPDSYVLLSELCNYSAKIARGRFQELRDDNRDLAKQYDKSSGALMKAAKATILPLALQDGCTLYKDVDAEGKTVGVLRGEKHQIGLHGLSEENLAQAAPIPEENKFTGFKRQWLSPVTVASFVAKTVFADVVGDASMFDNCARLLEGELLAAGYKGDAVSAMGRPALLEAFTKLNARAADWVMPTVQPNRELVNPANKEELKT